MPAKPPATPSGDATGASLFHFKLLPVKSSSNTASVRNPGLASPINKPGFITFIHNRRTEPFRTREIRQRNSIAV